MPKKPDFDDEVLYEQVVSELRKGERREGLWAKALTESLNNPDLAQSLYMKWRVAQLAHDAQLAASRSAKSSNRRDRDPGDSHATTKRPKRPIGAIILYALAAWFAYDGWLNQDPDMLEHVAFNRYGTAIC